MAWQVPGFRHRADLGGSGGRVQLAVDESSGELVVIKYLNTDEIGNDPAVVDRLRAAIDGVRDLPAEYFVRIRDLVEDSGRFAIVMDPVNGVTARELIRDHGALGVEAALVLYRDVLAGLAAAHSHGNVHGEVSPENVLVDADGRPLMTNTGRAVVVPRPVTLASAVYLAPERWRGTPPSAAADVYAAAAMFVEFLTGEPPFWEDTDVDRLRQRHEEEDVPVAEIPPQLHDLVRAGLAKRAEARLDAEGLLELLDVVAIAEYGREWVEAGRSLVTARVESLALPLGAGRPIESTEVERDTEDVANDDFYADAGAAAVAAAADIVELARMRHAAETAAMQAASIEEELTAEEEESVAEIERLLGLAEGGAAAAATEEAGDTAATAGGAGEAAGAAGGVGAVGEAADGAAGELGGAGADKAATPSEVSESGEAAPTGPAPVRASADAAVASSGVAVATRPLYRRHPYWSGAAALVFVLVVVGLSVWVGAGQPGTARTSTAASPTQPAATATVPGSEPSGGQGTGSSGPGAGPSTGTQSPAPGGGTETAGPSTSGSPQPPASAPPTLPVTGMAHPVRLMAAIAFGLVSAGAVLVCLGRRRDDPSAA